MHLVFNPDIFALGLAVGVLGLVLLLSLIISYAYDERTLLFLAAYMAVIVALFFAGERLLMEKELTQRLLLVSGPALMAALQVLLLKNRHISQRDKFAMAALGLVTICLLGFYALGGDAALGLLLSIVWFVLLVISCIYLSLQAWDTAGPWKWWLLLGHVLGLLVSMAFLTDLADANQAYWPVVLMLLLQAPPIYLSLVWRSRLLNEIRLRSAAANVIDPLTGLATTSVLIERLMRVMSRAHQARTGYGGGAIFLIDVKNWDGLVNVLGADSNEKLLLEAALRLRRSIGDNDLGARIAGGRFAVIAQGLANDHEVQSLATRLVVSGLRIDSPVLPGVELKFRVIVGNLKSAKPLTLPATQAWLESLTVYFSAWPGTHRSRSIFVVPDETEKPAQPEKTALENLDLKV